MDTHTHGHPNLWPSPPPLTGGCCAGVPLQVSAGALSLYLANMSVEDVMVQRRRAKWLHLLAVGCVMLSMTSDVVKMGFGLDPALPYNASLRYYEPPTS